MSIETTQQHRSDALTDRDRFALTWISHHYAIRLDHLQRLLGQHKGRDLSIGTVRNLASRWYHAGWVELRRFRVGELPWIWLTQEGLNAIGSHYPYCDFDEDYYPLAWLGHLAAVNDMHLQTSADWKTQRQLFEDGACEYESCYEPDAEICLPGEKIIAIKAQVKIKDASELIANLMELLLNSRYTEVWYFGVPDARAQIRQMVEYLIQTGYLSIEKVDRLRIKWYPLVQTDEDRQQEELETRIPVGVPAVF